VEEIIFAIPALPSLSEIATGKPLYQSVKELRIEDLIPRRPAKVNIEEIARFLSDKVVLVTRAGGSFGGELCKQLSSFPLKKLVLLSKGENSLFILSKS
jgi:FlaA1/EpsC-like NDP-sugar epimerase